MTIGLRALRVVNTKATRKGSNQPRKRIEIPQSHRSGGKSQTAPRTPSHRGEHIIVAKGKLARRRDGRQRSVSSSPASVNLRQRRKLWIISSLRPCIRRVLPDFSTIIHMDKPQLVKGLRQRRPSYMLL